MTTPKNKHGLCPAGRLRLARRSMSPTAYTMILAAFTGTVTGFLCVLLKWLIAWISHWFTPTASAADNFYLMGLPLIGLVLAAIFTRLILRRQLAHGTERLIDFLGKGGYAMSPKLTFGPIIANSLTLGFGGSAGAEGPIAVTGAAVSSLLVRRLGFTPEQIRLFIGFGAGAGIAAIFKAPVGGMLFALEILRLPFTTVTVLALLLACLASALTCFMFTGFSFDVFLQTAQPFSLDAYLALAVFGVAAGLYSLFYTHTERIAQRVLGKISPLWGQLLFAGVVMGILLYIFPALYGEGYGVMDRMLNGRPEALCAGTPIEIADSLVFLSVVIGGILLVKGFVVGLTTTAGVAGDFAPTLFAGSLAGLLFATIANSAFGLSLPVDDFALIGMCATFAGIIRAPFMAMFLTPEMTGNFTLFLPMVLASALSYGVVRLVHNTNFYHMKL